MNRRRGGSFGLEPVDERPRSAAMSSPSTAALSTRAAMLVLRIGEHGPHGVQVALQSLEDGAQSRRRRRARAPARGRRSPRRPRRRRRRARRPWRRGCRRTGRSRRGRRFSCRSSRFDYRKLRAAAMARDTNFYYSFLVLPASQRRAIVSVWDFCRAVDDAVDEPGRGRVRRRSGRARGVLARRGGARLRRGRHRSRRRGGPCSRSCAEFGLPAPARSRISSTASRWTSATRRYATFDDLREYCYRVASTVGLICVAIFGCRSEQARALRDRPRPRAAAHQHPARRARSTSRAGASTSRSTTSPRSAAPRTISRAGLVTDASARLLAHQARARPRVLRPGPGRAARRRAAAARGRRDHGRHLPRHPRRASSGATTTSSLQSSASRARSARRSPQAPGCGSCLASGRTCHSQTVIVVGGGVSGLAAAVRLAERGMPRAVARGARRARRARHLVHRPPDGRGLRQRAARVDGLLPRDVRVPDDDRRRAPRRGAARARPSPAFDRAGRRAVLRARTWPPPLHLLAGVLRWQGLSAGATGWTCSAVGPAMLQARRAVSTAARRLPVEPGRDRRTLAGASRPGPAASRRCCGSRSRSRRSTSTSSNAAASTFVRVLGRVFGPAGSDASIVLPKAPLVDVFGAPARGVPRRARRAGPAGCARAGVPRRRSRSWRGRARRAVVPATHVVLATPWHTWPSTLTGDVSPLADTLAAASATRAVAHRHRHPDLRPAGDRRGRWSACPGGRCSGPSTPSRWAGAAARSPRRARVVGRRRGAAGCPTTQLAALAHRDLASASEARSAGPRAEPSRRARATRHVLARAGTARAGPPRARPCRACTSPATGSTRACPPRSKAPSRPGTAPARGPRGRRSSDARCRDDQRDRPTSSTTRNSRSRGAIARGSSTRWCGTCAACSRRSGAREVRAIAGRVEIVLRPGADDDAIVERLRHTFGVANFGRACAATPALDDILDTVVAALGPDEAAPSFRVRARRADKRFPVPSPGDRAARR